MRLKRMWRKQGQASAAGNTTEVQSPQNERDGEGSPKPQADFEISALS
jgi:hypothetical protein